MIFIVGILVAIIIALLIYNITIHQKIQQFNNLNRQANNLRVLQDFLSTIGECSSVDEKIQKIIDDIKLKANNNSERQAYINIREYDITANSENTEYVLNQLFEKGIISKGKTIGKGLLSCIFSK